MEAAGMTTSRIGVQIGAPIEEGNEKFYIKFTLGVGKEYSDAQLSESKAALGGVDANLSVLLTVVAAPGKQQELAAHLEELLDGKIDAPLSKDLHQQALAGMVAFKVYQADGNRVVVHIKPGVTVEEFVKSQVLMIVQGYGLEAATKSEKTSISINAVSGVDFNDSLEANKTGLPTAATFGKSSRIEFTAIAPSNSILDQKMWEILAQFQPNSPAPLLRLLKGLDIDLTFRGIDELPADLQRRLKLEKWFFAFPQLPNYREGKPEQVYLAKLAELMESQCEISAALENLGALKLTTYTPGFGKGMTTFHD